MYPQYTTYYYPQYLQAKVGYGTPGGAAGLRLAPLPGGGPGPSSDGGSATRGTARGRRSGCTGGRRQERAGSPFLPPAAVASGTPPGSAAGSPRAARGRRSPRRAPTPSPCSRLCRLRPVSFPLAFPPPAGGPSSSPGLSACLLPNHVLGHSAAGAPLLLLSPGGEATENAGKRPKLHPAGPDRRLSAAGSCSFSWGGGALTSWGVAGRAYCCNGDGRNST